MLPRAVRGTDVLTEDARLPDRCDLHRRGDSARIFYRNTDKKRRGKCTQGAPVSGMVRTHPMFGPQVRDVCQGIQR